MAVSARRKRSVTPEQYLAMERKAETKSEYWNGEIYAMAGASRSHSVIVANVIISIGSRLRGRPCTVYPSDMRVMVAPTKLYTYPDVSVVCGQSRFEDKREDSLLNPSVIVEVLSPSTEAYDRGEKFANYRAMESLTDYLLIAQDHPAIEHYVRQADDKWLLSTYRGLETVVTIESIGCQLSLADVYDKVDLPSTSAAPPSLRVLREDDELYADLPEEDDESDLDLDQRPGF
jgi:Uma2 family endonuclease